jgi:hypothetical protein
MIYNPTDQLPSTSYGDFRGRRIFGHSRACAFRAPNTLSTGVQKLFLSLTKTFFVDFPISYRPVLRRKVKNISHEKKTHERAKMRIQPDRE